MGEEQWPGPCCTAFRQLDRSEHFQSATLVVSLLPHPGQLFVASIKPGGGALLTLLGFTVPEHVLFAHRPLGLMHFLPTPG